MKSKCGKRSQLCSNRICYLHAYLCLNYELHVNHMSINILPYSNRVISSPILQHYLATTLHQITVYCYAYLKFGHFSFKSVVDQQATVIHKLSC